MESVEIKAYQTHITIHPYHQGDDRDLEVMVSKKSKALHALIPIAYYIDTETETLYLPRGINLDTLEYMFKSTPKIIDDPTPYIGLKKGAMKVGPRNDKQVTAIQFLQQKGEYSFAASYSQLALNLPTGFGKTYCTINALVSGKKRAVIICHSKQIRDQWYNGLLQYTNLMEDSIMVIEGSKDIQAILDGTIRPTRVSYYIVLHQTLTKVGSDNWSIIEEFFKKVKVYVKVIDEAHLYFENSLMLDYFSNVPLTYYITATFGRSDPQEDMIYKKAYSQVLRYTLKSNGSDHNISYLVQLNSKPPESMIHYVEHGNSYGFSNTQYMKYELHYGRVLIPAVKTLLRNTMKIEGKRLITCNLVEGLEQLAKAAHDVNPEWNCMILKGNTPIEERKDIANADVICATSKIIGTGSDIPGLRILINTESMASKINVEQLIGRLRPYYDDGGDEKETIFMHVVDIGFPKCSGMCSRIKSTIAKQSLKFFAINL